MKVGIPGGGLSGLTLANLLDAYTSIYIEMPERNKSNKS